ncbi:Quinone oxidoreductase 1 [Streptomyces sp. YIM 130001]|uniref:NADP-dependent oxidoreductase n=1 Tax=Streptomyces sp. YIM 130001 TaxID=2259644 RepID=UPI000E64D64D|nr:NADP-dependent oxidoreductase [Streptomyces sp. YIM 130001]RII17096.1 Quinone oxidoreductase 1 [Streptomyces sp. YIM 130001]
MSRAVVYETFGGPEVLQLRDVPEPHAAAGEVRVRVTAVGLNPMDWLLASAPEAAQRFGITLPSGFGTDIAGVVDEVGAGVSGFSVGDRVYGGAVGRAAADHVVVDPSTGSLLHTPAGIGDEVAGTLSVAGLTAAAALASAGVKAGDTVLVGGAAGGVGVLTVQLAGLAGARVIGTASESTFGFLRQFGVEPVTYGPGLEDRVRELAPDGVSAATDLFGAEAAEAALALGVPAERIATIAVGANPPGGVRATGGFEARPEDLQRVAHAVATGEITVPIAATFPVSRIREAVELQAGRHVHGKVVVTL